jgi:predicted AAA+ superfamily ATPase
MKLTFARPYISINSFEEIDIADFCVITGLNGSGKTHLLKAINDGAIAISNIDPSEIVYYNYSDFIIHNGDPSADQQLQQKSMGYSNKTNLFNQRIYTERNTVLNAFTLFLLI